MKRRLFCLSISIICIALLFGACSKIEEGQEGNKNNDKSDISASGEMSEAGKTAAITMQIEDNNNNNQVQIPQFTSQTESAAITEINNEINKLVEFYKEADANKLKWPLIYTHIYEHERYLQAAVEYEACPDINGSSVVSYVYDRQTDSVVTLEDAMTAAEVTENSLKRGVERIRCKGGEELTEFEVQGFMFSSKGEPEFFIKYQVDTGVDVNYEIVTYIPSTRVMLDKTTEGIRVSE